MGMLWAIHSNFWMAAVGGIMRFNCLKGRDGDQKLMSFTSQSVELSMTTNPAMTNPIYFSRVCHGLSSVASPTFAC